MEVRCKICGKKEEISKIHKDYAKIASKSSEVYICEACSRRLSLEAARNNEIIHKNN